MELLFYVLYVNVIIVITGCHVYPDSYISFVKLLKLVFLKVKRNNKVMHNLFKCIYTTNSDNLETEVLNIFEISTNFKY